MDLNSLISYIRQSCMIDDPSLVEDSNYLVLEDKDIEIIINIADSRLSAYKSLLNEGNDLVYPLVLQAKKEIYSRLAVKYANDIDLKGEVGTLYKEQKFKHYTSLINQLEREWSSYIKELEANKDVSNTSLFSNLAQGEIFLSGKYFSPRNIQYATKPSVLLNVDNIYNTYAEISWKLKRINRFSMYNIYINNNTNIIDIYNNTNKVNGKKIFSTTNIHTDKFRVMNLTPNTIYHLAIVVQEQNGLWSYDEITFVTKGEEVNEE